MNTQPSALTNISWPRVRLEAMGVLFCGQSPQSSTVNREGIGSPYISGPEHWDGTTVHLDKWTTQPKRLVPDGCIFITVKGAGVGTVFPGVACAIGRDIYAFLPNKHVDPKYLEHVFRHTAGEVIRSARGDIPGLSKTHLLNHEVPHPPLDQQRRIVAEIEKQFTRLDAGVAALRRTQANLKRYRASVLRAACEGRLVPTEAELAKTKKRNEKFESGSVLLARILSDRRRHWQGGGKYKEPHSADTLRLPTPPNGWTWASPDQLAALNDNAICAGPFGTIFKAHDFRPSGVPIIFLRHVAAGRYLTHKPGFMDEQKWQDQFRQYSVFGGELLVTKLGEPPGVCAIYPEGNGPAMVTPDVIKIAVNHAIVSPRFLMHYFNSENARRFSIDAAFGTTRLRLTIPIFRGMPVPLPPLVEQTRIVAEVERRLSVLEQIEEVVNTKLQLAIRLRQSILQRVFSGAA